MGKSRIENVNELRSVAELFPNLVQFLENVALIQDKQMPDSENKDGEIKEAVTLMTIHAAKGLEFDVVFLVGLEEGLFPHEGHGEEERDEEEERRLFYVAMTRARNRLILTLARVRKIYGTDFLQEPSSFLGEIGGQHILYDESDGEDIIYA